MSLPATTWRPGTFLSELDGDNKWAPLVIVQRAPDDDGWLAVNRNGVVFNVFDSIARLYRPVTETSERRLFREAIRNPREWFGMRPVPLSLPKGWRK